MPDNLPQDWHADEEFWAEAWTDMEQQLDQKLPLKKRFGVIWYWLASGFALAVLLVVALYGFGLNHKPAAIQRPAVEEPFQGNSTPQRDQVSSGSGLSDENTFAVTTEAYPDKTASSVNKVKKQTPKEPETGTVSSIGIETDQPEEFTHSIPFQSVVETDVELMPASFSTAKIEPTSTELVNQQISHTVLDAVVTGYTALVLPQRIPPSPQPGVSSDNSIEVPDVTNISSGVRFGLSTGISAGGNLAKLDYWGDLQASKLIGKKSLFSVGLGYYFQRERFASKRDNGDLSDAAGEIVLPDSTNSTAFELAVATLDNGGRDFIRTKNIRLALNYDRILNKHWSVGVGLGSNYLLAAEAPELIFSPVSGQVSFDSQTNFVSFYQVNRLQTVNSAIQPTLSEEVGLQRWRFDLSLRAGYNINKRLGVNLQARSFISPLFREKLSVEPVRIELGATYRF